MNKEKQKEKIWWGYVFAISISISILVLIATTLIVFTIANIGYSNCGRFCFNNGRGSSK